MTTTETHQLTIARAIAYEIERHTGEPGWATESMVDLAHMREPEDGSVWQDYIELMMEGPWEPRPLTTLANARAAWVASGGDPERGPALEWGDDSMDATSVMWAVGDLGAVRVCIGDVEWCRGSSPHPVIVGSGADGPTIELLARIIRAVEEVTR